MPVFPLILALQVCRFVESEGKIFFLKNCSFYWFFLSILYTCHVMEQPVV